MDEKKLSIILFCMTTFVVGLIAEGGARIYEALINEPLPSERQYDFSPELGWTLRDGSFRMLNRDFDVQATVENGLRRTSNTVATGQDTIVNLFGDSFTFGVGVPDEKTIASFLSESLPGLRVNNYGVPGYSIDQYFLKYKQVSKSDDINVFILYTGNDYQEINSPQPTANYEKPFLQNEASKVDGFVWKMPEPLGLNQSAAYLLATSNTSANWLSHSRFIVLMKEALKNIEWVVRLRSQFVEPNRDYVHQAMARVDFLMQRIGKENSYFVIVPSYSLSRNISASTDEGYFRQQLSEYLSKHRFQFVDLYHEALLVGETDFWLHEGHPNVQGNRKIANAISRLLSGKRHISSASVLSGLMEPVK